VSKELTASQRAFHANLEDPRHGTQNGYANLRCRCDRCRAANTDYCRDLRTARASRIVPERLHGTVNAYSNYRCRCSQCRAAYNESRRTGRSRSLQTRELAEKMYEDYRSGMSISDVASAYGVSKSTVYYGFRAADLPLLRHHWMPTSALYFDYCCGMSLEDVAQKWDVSVNTVRNRFRDAGFALRQRPKKQKRSQANPFTGPRNTSALKEANLTRCNWAAQEHSEAWKAALPVSDERQSQVIRLRLEHPDWPLSRIGEEMDPPASKDTVSALLRRARIRGNELLKVAS